MTTREFSHEFDVLLNSFSTTGYPGPLELDEYEKSVFLTEAQELTVKELYTGGLGLKGFEETEELRRELEGIVKTASLKEIEGKGVSNNSKFFELPEDVWFITYESADIEGADCPNNPTVQVIPVRQDEWHKIKGNPFRRPNKRKAVRLDCGDNKVEIISEYPVTGYLIRYLKKPNPIILIDLEDLSINGLSNVTECELNPVLHRTILERAVMLASRRVSKKE